MIHLLTRGVDTNGGKGGDREGPGKRSSSGRQYGGALDPLVDGVVFTKVVRPAERLAAHTTHMRTVAGVDPLVPTKVLRPQEGPVTPDELALQSLPLNHHHLAPNNDRHGSRNRWSRGEVR